MPGSKAVKERIEELIAQAPKLLTSGVGGHQQLAWLTAAEHAVELVCPSASSPYRVGSRRIVAEWDLVPGHCVVGMVSMMERLLEEIRGGLLTNIENHAIALTFDDFLDHGAEYLKHGRKNEPPSLPALCSRTRSGASAGYWASRRTVSPWIR
jgi:hypothetical protein